MRQLTVMIALVLAIGAQAHAQGLNVFPVVQQFSVQRTQTYVNNVHTDHIKVNYAIPSGGPWFVTTELFVKNPGGTSWVFKSADVFFLTGQSGSLTAIMEPSWWNIKPDVKLVVTNIGFANPKTTVVNSTATPDPNRPVLPDPLPPQGN